MGARSGGGGGAGMGSGSRGGGFTSAPFPGAVKAKELKVGDTLSYPNVSKKVNVVGLFKEKGTIHVKTQIEGHISSHVKAYGANNFLNAKKV